MLPMDIWSILIIVFIFQGVFVLISILTSKSRRERPENRLLVMLVITLLWILFEFFCVRNKINVGLNIFYGTRYGSWLLLGPLVLFYFRIVAQPERSVSMKGFLHILPFVVFVIVVPLLFGDILNQRQIDYGMLSVFDHRKKTIAPMEYLYSYVFVLQFLSFALYLLFALDLVKGYGAMVKQEYAQINNRVKWLQRLLLSLIVIFLFTSVFLYLLLKTDIYRRYMDYLYVIPTGLLFFIIAYFLVDENWADLNLKKQKYAGSTFDQDQRLVYVEKLEKVLQKESVYLNPSIRLGDLAKLVGMSSHHLSQLLNQHFQLSFFDFINKYRVEKAKELMKDHPDRILLHIAYDSGFNNKTSFVNSFKKFENTTPSKFKEQLSL